MSILGDKNILMQKLQTKISMCVCTTGMYVLPRGWYVYACILCGELYEYVYVHPM